jgi:hypothetical protein
VTAGRRVVEDPEAGNSASLSGNATDTGSGSGTRFRSAAKYTYGDAS